jgi:hypothetical protein
MVSLLRIPSKLAWIHGSADSSACRCKPSSTFSNRSVRGWKGVQVLVLQVFEALLLDVTTRRVTYCKIYQPAPAHMVR